MMLFVVAIDVVNHNEKTVIPLGTLININMPGKCFYIKVLIISDIRSSTPSLDLRTTLMGKISLMKYDWEKKNKSHKRANEFRGHSETLSPKI